MVIDNIREELKTKSIYDIPLRVTYYARVSSDSDEQLNSLENQVDYFKGIITKNSKWTFIPGYVDEGISGMSTRKRENFNKMIEDGESGTFDLILTKEISRFARNTIDSLQYTRQLLSAGVGVLFMSDNLNTLFPDSELRLTIMSSIAQEEIRKMSERIRFGHKQAIKSGVVLGNNRIFGYTKDNKRLVIDEEEAKMVRELFTLYSTDEYSMKQLEKVFWEKGYRNRNGNKIAHSTMSGIIANPKYKGYYVGNRVKVVDMFTKKQRFLPEEEWVMFKDETGEIVPAIVEEALWDKANEILKRRSDDVKNRQGQCNHGNLLTGKLFCSDCGKSYYRKEAKNRNTGEIVSKWVCSGKINNGADSCKSFAIYENEVKDILIDIFVDLEIDIQKLIDDYLEMFKEVLADGEIQRNIENYKVQLNLEEQKKDKLLDFNVAGKISDAEYLRSSRKCDAEIEKISEEIRELEEQLLSKSELKERMDDIQKTLTQAKAEVKEGLISKAFVNKFIDKIIVTPITDNQMKLDIKLFTGKSCEKIIKKLQSRTGHTTKKMIKSYEEGMK
ncbi:MAG: recombinase family protein [Ruminococcaceae bacterium]|nr:recombinase family protein [Oscillospiraceae bacterium]